MKRPSILVAALLVLLLLGVVAGWMLLRGAKVDALELHYAPLVRTLQFSARVATLARVDIGSTVTGRVVQVLVREGATVRQGDVLLQLESDELRAALAQSVASEQQAASRLAGLRSSGRASARAALAQADATLRAANAELVRTQQLVDQGFLSASRLDDARRAVQVAQAQQTGATAQLQANDDNGTDVAQAQAQLAQSRAAAVAARARLTQTRVVAPTDARVLSRQVESGQIVQPGRALMSLALDGPTQLVAQVDERFLDQLQTGQAAAVVADAFSGQRFAAQVLSIAPAVDAQRGAIEIKFSLNQKAPTFLREDMTLSVEVETGRRERALVLPVGALRTKVAGSSATVLVDQQGRAVLRSVRLGLRTLEAVEILEGLAEGQTVLLGAAVQPGDRVRSRVVVWQPGVSVAPGASRPDAASALTSAIGR